MQFPEKKLLIQKISLPDIEICIKREDLIHPQISGNKYWKLFLNLKQYLSEKPENAKIITFGGAFSNHISATAFAGKKLGIATLGIIRGEEVSEIWPENPTLRTAFENGMEFRFVPRDIYRDKDKLIERLSYQFPEALILPEGGTGPLAVEGIRYMMDDRTADFNYICCAVGTGGTLAGLSKHAEAGQKVLGFKVVKDPSLGDKIKELSGRDNFELIDASFGGYGKISEEVVTFINEFYTQHGIRLDPVYTGKMMMKLRDLINNGYFEPGSRILAFHTGGLQGIEGANQFLKSKKREQIIF